MSRVKFLPEELASQVAAGEVVERPASVAKELIENSLDAGAGQIDVRMERGGAALLRVGDDGMGMARDDAMMAIERHATSKIRTKEDLESVVTMGFRGEALAAVASVSRFRLTTREAGSLSGTEVVVEGGKLKDVRDWGGAPGTVVEVRSLFFNMPARRKFLRTEATESSHIEQQVKLHAVARPDCGFALWRGDQELLHYPSAPGLLPRVAELVGAHLAARLVPISGGTPGTAEVSGLIGGPGEHRSGRGGMYAFLNGRPIDAGPLLGAIREGYGGALPQGRFPSLFLFLEVPHHAVDVNVHPAKREVRFRDGIGVKRAVATAIRESLERARGAGHSTVPTGGGPLVGLSDPPTPGTHPALPGDQGTVAVSPTPVVPVAPAATDSQGTLTTQPSVAPGLPVTPPEVPIPAADFRILGTVEDRYLVLDSPTSGLTLLSARAAGERIQYEKLMGEAGADPDVQMLLVPITVELPPADFDLACSGLEMLAGMGFIAEEFGRNTLKVEGVPAPLVEDEPVGLLDEAIAALKGGLGLGAAVAAQRRAVAAAFARRVTQTNPPAGEAARQALLQQLLQCEMPYCCPAGLPTLLNIGSAELERRFRGSAS